MLREVKSKSHPLSNHYETITMGQIKFHADGTFPHDIVTGCN